MIAIPDGIYDNLKTNCRESYINGLMAHCIGERRIHPVNKEFRFYPDLPREPEKSCETVVETPMTTTLPEPATANPFAPFVSPFRYDEELKVIIDGNNKALFPRENHIRIGHAIADAMNVYKGEK